MVTRIACLFVFAVSLVSAEVAHAWQDGAPAISFEHASVNGGAAVNVTDGWEFSVKAPVTLTALGVWDHQNDGLNQAIPVGLWDTDGRMLASATVPAGTAAEAVKGFRYVSIDALRLRAGNTYVIGAAYTPGTKENVVGGGTAVSFSTDGAIRWNRRRRIIRKPGLTFPELELKPASTSGNPGAFGPNFLMEEATTPRHYSRSYWFGKERQWVRYTIPESDDGSHKHDPVIFISAFAKKTGELTRVLVNGKPFETGPDAVSPPEFNGDPAAARPVQSSLDSLNAFAAAVKNEVARFEDATGVKPNVRISAVSWARYSEVLRIVDATAPRRSDSNNVRSTMPLTLEFATPRDNRIPLTGADIKGRFVDRGEFIEDKWTGLLWQKDGHAAGKFNYYGAADYAAELELNGVAGWRVPTAEELATIFPAVDAPFKGTSYDKGVCCVPDGEYASYWTSELDSRRKGQAFTYRWYANGGAGGSSAITHFVYVRCVRDSLPEDAAR